MQKQKKNKGVSFTKPHLDKLGLPKAAMLAIILVVVLIGAYILQYKIFPNGMLSTNKTVGGSNAVTEIAPTTSVRINEVMTSNGSAWSDEKGNFVDWVEITNTSSNESVDISGWILAKGSDSYNVFTFPSQVLAPGEYVLVFCDGTLKNTPGYNYHAPFKLSNDGDTLQLYNRSQNAVESINIPALKRNQSYAKIGSSWQTLTWYTPNMPNDETYYRAMTEYLAIDSVSSGLVISEIMADNATYQFDDSGMYWDYVEIYNSSSSAVDLSGWSLSDNVLKVTKWRFPEGTTIGAGEYLLVLCNGLDTGLNTNFKLNAEGETVILADARGIVQASVTYSNLKADRSWSLYDGSYTIQLSPTPGKANTAASAAAVEKTFKAANTSKIFISEVSAATSRTEDESGSTPGWIELHNTSSAAVDLSNWGLSDEPDQPRKWQFPEGAVIKAGEYLVIRLGGDASVGSSSIYKYTADFSVSMMTDAMEEITLCMPDGTVVDRMPLPKQYASVSYGRIDGEDGFFYLAKMTVGQQNTSVGYSLRTFAPTLSVESGMYDNAFTVEITAQPNTIIRYTTDGAIPTTTSPVYEGPITISETTVLRTRCWRDNEYPSATTTATYFVGVSHTVNIMSIVMNPDDLWSNEKGIYVKGPNALAAYPYGSINQGANFWMVWEKSAYLEYFGTDGTKILSQGCGLRLHGQYSRVEDQKAFKLIARYEYDDTNRFSTPLFSNRDYTEYQSFVLRSSGSDGDKTRMRDSVLQGLASNTCVMYQETEIVVVYLNGKYWGQYNLRERINQFSVAQFEGWSEPDNVDLVKANTNVLHGSDETYQTMLSWVKKNGVKNSEALAYVESVIDVDNFIEYMCLEIFTGNTDTLNVKRYRNGVEGDGRWRWILFDLDWAFYTDTNSIARWIAKGGMGNGLRTDNTLFVALMNNSTFRDRFLTRFGEMMGNEFTTQSIVDRMNARVAILYPEMEMHCAKWNFSIGTWRKELSSMKSYAESRPQKLLDWTQKALNLSDSEMQHYFADAIKAIKEYKNKQ